MKKNILSMLLLASLVTACTPKDTTLTFIETTDTHGRFDNFANDAACIKQMQSELGDKLILLDVGDNLQGTPFQYCSNHDETRPNLVSSFLNFFPYDVACIGNHDIEAGKTVFDRIVSEAEMPVVCANIIDEETGDPYFQPYAILNREGYKIAVLGLLTPYVVTWVPDRLRPGLRFEQLETAAEKWVKTICEKEHPDLIVGLLHSGWELPEQSYNPESALGCENATKWVAENVPGFDLIFYGHDHKAKAEAVTNINGDTVYVLNSGSRAQGLAKAEIRMNKGKKASVHVEIITTDGEEKDAGFEALLQPYLDFAEAYQNEEVADLPVSICSNDAFKGSCLWVDEIHRCQFDAVAAEGIRADISFAAPLSYNTTIEAGRLRVKDFFAWYPFENSLAVMAMTGQEVIDFLEYAYETKSPIYSFDSGAGILYEVNDQAKSGQRIRILSMADGTSFDTCKTYNVVMNSYRSMGGGNHFMNGCGWQQSDIKGHVVWQNDRDLRSIFIDWARQKGSLDNEPLNNWTILQ